MGNKILAVLSLGIILGFSFLFFKDCTHQDNSTNTVKRDTLWIASKDPIHSIGDTTPKPPVTIINNYNYEMDKGPIDTGAVIRDYFSKKFYSDSLVNDSISIYVSEDIFKNELIKRKVGYRWKAPERIIKETNTIYKNDFYLGISGVISKTPGLSFDALYERDKWAYGLGYDFICKGPRVTVYKKIRWKKK